MRRRALLRAFWVGLFMVIAMSFYFLIAHDGALDVTSTKFPIDDRIPLLPIFVWVYLSPYFLSPLLVISVSPSMFSPLVKRGLVLIVLQLLIFWLLPTLVQRPDLHLDANASVSEHVLQWVYTVDTPSRNAAPSGHVSLLVVLCWAISRNLGRWSPGIWFYCFSVSVSIVFTKQHHLFDLVTGALIAVLVLWVAARTERVTLPTPRQPLSG